MVDRKRRKFIDLEEINPPQMGVCWAFYVGLISVSSSVKPFWIGICRNDKITEEYELKLNSARLTCEEIRRLSVLTGAITDRQIGIAALDILDVEFGLESGCVENWN